MTLVLEPGVVDVWRADIDLEDDRLERLLSAAERERAAAFHSDRAGARWGRARGLLRDLLGRYLDRDPRRIELNLGPKGKPALAGAEPIEFNVSHSDATALLAFALENPVGVDVELTGRKVRDALGAAARVLGDAEAEWLRSLPPERRDAEFLRVWVRHEAALKCRGAGLGSPARLDGLWVRDLEVGPDAVAALALERPPERTRLRMVERVPDAR